MEGFTGKICTKGVWDESIPGIYFDKNGVSNYAKIFDRMINDFPRGERGLADWTDLVSKIKKKGEGNNYDCIVGVSGGTDSSFLLHVVKEYGLKPLAVNLDNGWGSNVSVSNIKRLIEPLKIDLETYVIDYEEVIDVLKAYMRARLPWVDGSTDLAIKSILYKTAYREKIKYILIGHDFRSEGFQPNEWTYSDAKQMKYLCKTFSNRKLRSFPSTSIWSFGYLSFFKDIKLVKPFFYLPYTKDNAKQFLKKEYNWEDYGGHHYENIFTKFIISYWLYKKFGIDKRKITLSAQVMSGEISRESALEIIAEIPYNNEKLNADIEYLIKKLKMPKAEFYDLLNGDKKYFYNYPSYYPLYQRYNKIIFKLMKYFLPDKPLMFYQMENRANEK
jgi:N-acetyl sugar amidotransferase